VKPPFEHNIPRIDIGALFGQDLAARSAVDQAILTAARSEGMLVITGLPHWAVLSPAQRSLLLSLFALPEADIRKLWRWNFDPAQANVYRGWFPLQNGLPTYKQGIDMGPDIAYGPRVVDPRDPLLEATPLPPEDSLPGWHACARDYYLAMVRLSEALMHSLARSLGLPEHCFDEAFKRGVSTLRLLHYPVRPPESFEGAAAEAWAVHQGESHYLLARAHVDTGFITLLAQDGVDGLQAQHLDGTWMDVPPEEATLAVNFGKVLERWTGGAIRATVHRVLGNGRERHSIPFFYEAGVDAVIAPLPLAGGKPFDPFYFGDHLWDTTTQFVEQRGIAHLRQPLGPPPAPAITPPLPAANA
jgi:isopenicillin N synthase-like dioxygenase